MPSPSERVPSSILFVGLGAMGTPMATQLASAGHHLTLFDVDRQRAAQVANEIGASTCKELAGAPTAPDFAILMLPDSGIVESVLTGGPDGGLLGGLTHATVVVDMGSSEPSSTVSLAEVARNNGITLVDAPVSGGVSRAVTGELSIMFGGSPEMLERCRPMLSALGTSIVHTGPVGSGHAMKALNNLLGAIGLVAASEVLCIGTQFGLEPAVMLEVLNSSTGRNQATEVKFAKHVLSRNFDSGFLMRLMVKDLTTALNMAHGLKATAPLAAACYEAWIGAEHLLNDPDADHTEVVRYVERNIGVELR